MTRPRLGVPDLGIGVGLRVPHYRHILEQRPHMDFFEIISENFMVAGGKPIFHLERIMENYRLIQHGVSLSIGGPEAPDRDYLRRLKQLVRKVNPPWLSDHFCWCGVPGAHLHDLLPLPYTWEAVELVAERARQVQDYLEVPFALENTSSYMTYTSSEMNEWEFISEVAERADIGLMFDVNNVYVSAFNHGFDAYEFVRSIPHERIVQIHLAGHSHLGKYIIDTHRGQVVDEVWDLYRATLRQTGSVSTLIEWDDEIPAWSVLADEAEKARRVRDEVLGRMPLGAGSPQPIAAEQPAPPACSSGRSSGHGGPRELAADENSLLGEAVAE
jgi:uncharacterized protein